MEKAKISFIVDLGLLVSFLAVGISGILKLPVAMATMGLEQRDFQFITPLHDISGVVMVLLGILHVALHWNWLVGMAKSNSRKK